MSRRKPFIARALSGGVLFLREIDEDIRRRHETNGSSKSLHEWLGMTRDEYVLWVERPAVLPFILQARRAAIPLEQHLASIESFQNAPRMASRANAKEAGSLMTWLRSTGRLRNGTRAKKRS